MFERIDGRLMNVVAFGDGPPLLLVSGWIGPWQVWRQTMELLAADYRCIAYDHRGAGQTVGGLDEVTFDALVDDVFAVLDHLGTDRCWIGGESQGGAVACAAVLRHPDRFHGQFLIGSGPEIVFGERERRFADGLESDPEDTLAAFIELVFAEPDADHYKRWLRAMLNEADPGAGAILLRALGGTTLSEQLGEVQVPTLVIHGLADRIADPDGARALAGGIPGARLELLDGVGHVPTITRPGDVARLIRDFVAQTTR